MARDDQVGGELVPIERRKGSIGCRVAARSGNANRNGLCLRSILPNHRRTQLVLETGVNHQDFIIAAHIYDPQKPLENGRVSAPLIGNERELVSLRGVSARLDLAKYCGVCVASALHTS